MQQGPPAPPNGPNSAARMPCKPRYAMYREAEPNCCGRAGPSPHSLKRDGWFSNYLYKERDLEDEMDGYRARLVAALDKNLLLKQKLAITQARLVALGKERCSALNSFNKRIAALKN